MPNATDKSIDSILPFFPAGFPDETIGSRISRYHILRGQPTTHETYKQLFNRFPFSANGMVHPHLDELARKLPGSAVHNLMALKNESTLAPLFQRFAGTQIDQTDDAGAIDMRSVGRPRRIRGDSRLTHICPQCLGDDQAEVGSPYIHRSHQIPGVTTCWRHETKLLDRCPSCHCPFARSSQIILSAWLGCACGASIADYGVDKHLPALKIEKEFSQFAQQLLASETCHLKADELVAIYRQRALELGYVWGTGQVNRRELFADLAEFFGTALLGKMDPAYAKGQTSGWFHLLTPSASIETPLNRHIIFAYFLFRDAAAFLARSASAVANRVNSGVTCDTHHRLGSEEEKLRSEDPAQELFLGLIDAADRFGYGTAQWWQHHFSGMKRLVKMMPEASTLLEAHIQKSKEKRVRASLAAAKTRERLRQADMKWAGEMATQALKALWQNIRPIKLTKHQILNGGSNKRVAWPDQLKFPLTCVAVSQGAESTWHFYARRMLWTLQALHDPDTPEHKIIFLSGLELYKARAILDFFSDVVRGTGPSMEVIRAILKARGVGVHWPGPCPDQEFYSAGRGYKLRTSRWGPIGGKAGEATR